MIEWWGPIIHEYYSGTEGLGMTWITSAEALTHPGSVGRAIWGEVHVCGEDGEEVPAGEDGVVYFGSGSRTSPSSTTTTPRRPGRPSTTRAGPRCGTSAISTTTGYLYLTDRKQFMIVSGGVNIYPQEIEDVLVLHPAVADVAVFGVPEPEMGEEVKAVVQPAARRRRPAPSSKPRSSPSAGTTSRTTSARGRSTSPTRCRAARTASSTRSRCATPTGRARPPARPERSGGGRTSAYQASTSATTAPNSSTVGDADGLDHRPDQQVPDADGAAEAHHPQRHDPAAHVLVQAGLQRRVQRGDEGEVEGARHGHVDVGGHGGALQARTRTAPASSRRGRPAPAAAWRSGRRRSRWRWRRPAPRSRSRRRGSRSRATWRG